MAINHSIPILLKENHSGMFTAIPIIENPMDGMAGFSASAKGAITQVKTYFEALLKDPNGDFYLSPLIDIEFTEYSVSIRPEYQIGGNSIPCENDLKIRIECVLGKTVNSTLNFAIMPQLGIQFCFFERKRVSSLINEIVQGQLKGVDPAGLYPFLPPRDATLESVKVKSMGRRRGPNHWSWFLGAEHVELTAVAENLNQPGILKRFGGAHAREREIDDLKELLLKGGQNLIILGESGVGKTSLLANALRSSDIREMEAEERPTFWLTSAEHIIAGMSYLGQWEQRCTSIVEELSNTSGILVIENLLDLITSGNNPESSIAAFFHDYLLNREIRMIVESTPGELDAAFRLLPGFCDLFHIFRLNSLSSEAAVSVLETSITSLSNRYRVTAQRGLTSQVYRLFKRFFPYAPFPGHSITFLAELFSNTSLLGEKEATINSMVDLFVEQSGLPPLFLRDDLTLSREKVVDKLHQDIIGQEKAVEAVSDVVLTLKAGMNDPQRPVGVLFFAGPTGVGKTALARSLSRFCFGHGAEKDRLIRLDMSEYAIPGSASQLVTNSEGQPSDLIRRLRNQPFNVLLLDEVEKAAADVFDILLGVLDEGRLTDKFGRATSFTGSIIIMTSNLGASKQNTVGFDGETAPSFQNVVQKFFRPEFFNRIDQLVEFQTLDENVVEQITRKELDEVADREGFQRANLQLEYDDQIVELLMKKGFDSKYGARPLQRAIEALVVTPLALFLVQKPGLTDAVLRVANDGDGGEVVVRIGG